VDEVEGVLQTLAVVVLVAASVVFAA